MTHVTVRASEVTARSDQAGRALRAIPGARVDGKAARRCSSGGPTIRLKADAYWPVVGAVRLPVDERAASALTAAAWDGLPNVVMESLASGTPLVATPAGLLDLAPESAEPELTLSLTEDSPFGLARAAFSGEKPAVRIEGDVQLAAEVNWLVDHVRWDVEDDLARLIGDVPAHTIATGARRVVDALRRFVGERSGKASGSAGAE